MARQQNAEIIYRDINETAYIQAYDDVTNANSVSQAIRLIIATPKRSRAGRPKFGSYVGKYLFDPFDITTAHKIQTEIIDALEDPANGELGRVYDLSVEVVMDWDDVNYWVRITGRVPKLEQESVSTTFTLRSTA